MMFPATVYFKSFEFIISYRITATEFNDRKRPSKDFPPRPPAQPSPSRSQRACCTPAPRQPLPGPPAGRPARSRSGLRTSCFQQRAGRTVRPDGAATGANQPGRNARAHRPGKYLWKAPDPDRPGHLAKPGSERAAVATGNRHDVTFGGRRTATIRPAPRYSAIGDDAGGRALAGAGESLLPAATPMETFHWDGRQAGWIVAGEQTQSHALQLDAADSQSTTARLLLTGILVETETATRTLVTLSDSITDGASASLDRNSRWPDFLAERLAPHGVAVVNAGFPAPVC